MKAVEDTTKVEAPKLLRAGAALGGVYFALYVLAPYCIACKPTRFGFFPADPQS